MFYLNLFKRINNNKAFLVVPSAIKKAIIKIKTNYEMSLKKIFSFKVVTTTELVELLSFSVDNEIYLNNLEKQQTPVSITKELIKFSKYNFNNKNKELSDFINNNSKFINVNNSFTNKVSTYKFYIIGPTHLIDPFVNHYNLNIEIINPFNNESINSQIFKKFNNKEDEIFYIMEEISKLLNQNIDSNNIFIANYEDKDYTTFNKLASFYNIPIIYNNNTPLVNIPYINKLLSFEYEDIINLLTNKEQLIEVFNDYYIINQDEFNNNINTVINIFNKYPHHKYNNKTSFSVILEEIKLTYINTNVTNGIKMIKLDEILTLSNKDFVFIINGNYESFPNITKDSDYLSDTEKELINYPTSTKVNISNNIYLESLISSPVIKQISYSLKDIDGEYSASDLFSQYSKEDSKIKIDFSTIQKGYAKNYYKTYFSNNKKGLLQTTFNPSFKIKEEERILLSNYIENKELKLSPTDITTYIQAPFVYYLERIIGLNTFKENVSLNLGNFFHIIVEVLLLVFFETKVDRSKDNQTTKFAKDEEVHNNIFNYIIELSEVNKDDFDFNKFFDEFYNIYFKNELNKINKLHTNNLSNNDKLLIRTLFYIKKHKNVIVNALILLVELEELIPSNELIVEKPIEVENLKGKADLIKLYNNKTYSIIDYKTGSRDAFNVLKIDELLDKLISDNANEEISFGALNLLQLILYSYILSKAYSDYKLKDLSYYSYFTNKLNGITTETFETKFYTGGKNRIIDNLDILNKINNKIEILLSKTIKSIKSIEFNTELRRDEKSKLGLDESYYSIYEALMFFSEEGSINEEED